MKRCRGGKAGKSWSLLLNGHNMTILQLHSVAAGSLYLAADWDLMIGTGGVIFFLSFFLCGWFHASPLD